MRRTHNRLTWILSLAVLAFTAVPVMAQDGETTESTSMFQMFFWSDDPLGLLVTWSLIIMSVMVMGFSLMNLMRNKKETILPIETVELVEELLEEKKFEEAIEETEEDESIFGQMIHSSLSEASSGYSVMEKTVDTKADELSAERIRSLTYLDVLGAVGPMVGLFGTVYGMILAFQQIVESGGQPKPAELAAGISTSLVTTFWGLVVGIPAVASAALLRNKIDGLTAEAVTHCGEMISQFRPRAAGAPAAKKKAAPAKKAAKPAE